MKKKTTTSEVQLNWNPANKEPWHLEFDKELVNDEMWTCIVAAIVPFQVEDEECIQIFSQSVATGLRKSIIVITAADIIRILQEQGSHNGKGKIEKKSKNDKSGKNDDVQNPAEVEVEKRKRVKPPLPRASPIVNLVAKYSTITETEVKSPPDLMASIIKYAILNIKDENVFRKKVDAVKKRKMRERNVKVNFIKSMKPFNTKPGESCGKDKNQSEKPELINDEPHPGPDLYIVLKDFFDPFYFPELLKINVPFMALLKISHFKEMTPAKFSQTPLTNQKTDALGRKEALISTFWKILAENCSNVDKTTRFKDFAFMEYQPQMPKVTESKHYVSDVIFDEVSWMLYTVFTIHRQHEAYLREMHVQRMIVALEPLDLSACNVYNKICDDVISTEPCAILFVIFAIVEQVAVGVPSTKSRVFCYESEPNSQYFFNAPNSRLNPVNPEGDDLKFINKMDKITSCLSCNQNKINHSELICRHLSDKMPPITNDRSEEIKTIKEVPRKINNEMNGTDYAGSNADRSLLPNDRGTKEKTREDFWTNSDLCFYSDKLTFHTYHSDFSLVDLNLIVNRFFKNTDLLQIWCKYPKLSPEKKAFYNFHFLRLLQITKCDKELLKKKIFFLLAMKLIGITKSYLFKGEEENLSDLFRTPSRDKTKKFSKVKFNPHGDIRQESQGDRNFAFCSFRLFNPNANGPKMVTVKTENAREVEKPKNSFLKADSVILRKVTSIFNMSLVTHRNSGYCFSYFLKPTDLETASSPFNVSPMDQEFSALYSLLDCYEISSLLESHMLNNSDEYVNLVKNFNFFEVLESERMVQRLLEAQEAFNTTQCSYFAPTDTLIVILHNESDHRGVFYTCGYGSLLTPVCLRDFYAHVYPEISEWLAIERHEYIKFVTKVDENTKELELKNTKEYLSQLKRKFKAMSEAEKEKFLNEDTSLEFRNQEEIEVVEDELEDLPPKIKPDYPRKLSFIGTDFSRVRVETEKKVHEFHSRDTTRINFHIDSWLHESNRLLTLEIQQSVFRFWYHQWLGKEPNTLFTLKTTSDTIFVFYKESAHEKKNTHENYHVKISWPTGLIIQGIFDDVSNVYIKQNYLTVYKKWWNLEKEKCRRFLKNGQILIFKKNEQVEVLCASGTKHIMGKSSSKRKEGSIRCFETFQTVTMTGQVWETNNIGRGHCQNRPKLVDHIKVFVGVDPKTKETYYRRDDGVTCMLWPDGKLVTNFPDGTKITSTPDFDPTEIIIEWTEEEQVYFELLKSNRREETTEQRPKSKTILKKSSPDSIPELSDTSLQRTRTSYSSDGFLSVSVSYLMEHPKYSTVYYDFRCSKVEIKMPTNLSFHIHLDGTYLISRENNFFAVQPDSAELYTVCTGCGEKSSATVYFDSGQTLCKFVDLLGTTFHVYRNGEVMHHDHTENDFKNLSDSTLNKSHNFPCKFDHNKSVSGKQRCFALERDLSGTEFLHNESLAHDFYQLPRDTHYNLHRKNETNSILTHLFSIPYYRVGHESWTMDYEVRDNSTPSNLNKNDLNELGTKNDTLKLHKYPFSKNQSTDRKNRCRKLNDKPKNPKLVVIRVVKCLSENPKTVIDELKTHIGIYQRKAHDLFKMYKKNKSIAECFANNSKQIKKNLQKISLPPDRWRVMSPQISTEMDIHFSGHYFNLIDELYTYIPRNWPQCKQSANSFLTTNGILTVHEGVEFQRKD